MSMSTHELKIWAELNHLWKEFEGARDDQIVYFLNILLHFDYENGPRHLSTVLDYCLSQPVSESGRIFFNRCKDVWGRREKDLAFWQEYLRDLKPCYFPDLRERGTDRGHGSKAAKKFSLPGLASFCETYGIPSDAVLQVAWGLTVGFYSDSQDICFVHAIQDDQHNKVNDILCTRSAKYSFYGNLRQSIRRLKLGSQPLHDLVESFDKNCGFTSEHGYCFPDEIHARLKGHEHAGLYNSTISTTPENRQNYIQTDSAVVIYAVYEDDELDVQIRWEFSQLAEAQVDLVIETFLSAVRAILQNPQTSVDKLDLSPCHMGSMAKWLAERPPPTHKPAVSCIHDRIAENAAKRPTAPAISSKDIDWNYQDLDQLTTRIAYHLRSQGVRQGISVLLCISEPHSVAAAMIGVWKAGGACVRWDPDESPMHPDATASEIATVVLLLSGQDAEIPSCASNSKVLMLPTFSALWSDVDCNVDSLLVVPTDTAIIMILPGSQSPQRIAVDHQSYCSHLCAQASAWGITSETRAFEHAGFSPGNMVSMTLLAEGACLCIAPNFAPLVDGYGTINVLARLLSELNADMCFLSPTLAGSLEPEAVPALRTLILNGEPASFRMMKLWERRRLIVCYEPSGLAISCSTNDHAISDPANLGAPVGVVLWICDVEDHDKPVPIGTLGEIVVDGPIVAGSMTEPAGGDSPFVKRPKWATPLLSTRSDHSIVYKTGDQGYYNTDGTVTIVRRKGSPPGLYGFELTHVERVIRHQLSPYSSATVYWERVNEILVVILHLEELIQASSGISSKGLFDEMKAFLQVTMDEWSSTYGSQISWPSQWMVNEDTEITVIITSTGSMPLTRSGARNRLSPHSIGGTWPETFQKYLKMYSEPTRPRFRHSWNRPGARKRTSQKSIRGQPVFFQRYLKIYSEPTRSLFRHLWNDSVYGYEDFEEGDWWKRLGGGGVTHLTQFRTQLDLEH